MIVAGIAGLRISATGQP